ncbi:lipase family protein [Salinispira pacifica]|uniref:Lipase family protein n=1 Tax=Salinispira pacifica TaxID=1307761 RepID=V5WGC7_9SPIO|nr:DUF2974 domain-containing protein [Salinispira pacifica]AHC14892.1 lipase family protein [Salinispira pacifica]
MNYLAVSREQEARHVRLLNRAGAWCGSAYDDRTSWLMACMAELAYVKFNPGLLSDPVSEELVSRLEGRVKKMSRGKFRKFLQDQNYDHRAQEALLRESLGKLGFTLEGTFDTEGIQAFLARWDDRLVLSFRGTELDVFRDIKRNLRVSDMAREGDTRLHRGFLEGVQAVQYQIEQMLKSNGNRDLPLFITGHSQGGALAAIAAGRIQHAGGIAACYSFGAPRFSNMFWVRNLKTPLYRVVNAADAVPLLPPRREIVFILAWFVKLIPSSGDDLHEKLISALGQYSHVGDMRYLSNCPAAEYGGVRLLHHTSTLYRLKAAFTMLRSPKIFLRDHSIRIYREKLLVIAERRLSDGAGDQ